ncbi:hypothetical protein Ahy_B01g056706 [Arachis hypogaea]|uniref:Protein FAR1-RELATED SEQUENCE n=1 Tax=Arachis hypogaea TaxID=3818 RepID=A0A445AZE3_ARAHY|nr:hypothetical protein Ahy_B01g056706 [Arachis hypogaea]
MTFKTLEEARKFYKDYSKLAGFSTKIRNTTRKEDEIKNKLITCSREGKRKSKISPTLKTNSSAGINCPARIYVYILKDVGLWIISKVVLNHSHHCCPNRAEMLKQHRELSMFVCRTIENNEEAGIRPSKTYQPFVATTGSHHELKTQFQYVYTHEKFREVQVQFREKVNCITRSMNSTLGFMAYEVVEQVSNSTFNKFIFTYDTISREVKCQCLLFESRGILCRHSLRALGFERVEKVAPKYILEHWSKNVKRRHTHIKSSQDEPLLEPRSKRFDDLVFQSHNICEFVSEFKELTGILHRTFDNVMDEMQEYQAKSKGKYLLSYEDVTLNDVNDLQIPPRVRTRGRPKNKLGSNMKKKIANAIKKKKASSKRVEPFRWWVNDLVKLQVLCCTGYELSQRGL